MVKLSWNLRRPCCRFCAEPVLLEPYSRSWSVSLWIDVAASETEAGAACAKLEWMWCFCLLWTRRRRDVYLHVMISGQRETFVAPPRPAVPVANELAQLLMHILVILSLSTVLYVL